MSNTGSIPPSSPSLPQAAALGAKGDVRASVLNMPEPLKNLPQPVRTVGEVIGDARGGALTVRTQSGDIQLRVPPDRAPPEGSRVEVDLPAGDPPRQATIRPAPPERTTPERTTQERTTPEPRPAPPQNTPPPTDRVEVRENRPPPTETPPPPPHKVKEGEDIRLRPLPPDEKILATRPAPAPDGEIKTNPPPKIILGEAVDLRPPGDAKAAKASIALLAAQHMMDEMLRGLMPVTLATLSVSDPRPSLSAPVLSGLHDITPPVITVRLNDAMRGDMRHMLQNAPLPDNLPKGIAASLEARLPALHHLPSPAQLTLMPMPTQAPSMIQHMTGAFMSFLNGFMTAPPTDIPPAIPLTTAPPVAAIAPPAIMNMRIMQVDAPDVHYMGQSTQTSILHHQAGRIAAHITGFTPQGFPVLSLLSMPDTPMMMNFDATNFDKGSVLSLLPQTASAPMAGSITTSPPAPMPFAFPDIFWSHAGWPSMDELANHMQRTAPVMLTTLSATTPNPANPVQLPAAALLFIAAARAGDVGGWLSDKGVDHLRRAGKGELLSRLTREMGSIGRLLASDPAPGAAQEWRGVPLPLYYEGDLHKAIVWFRQEGQGRDEKDGPGGKAARFIFDLSLSRMGNVQLDGLFRGQRIDLMLRTEQKMSENMRQIMRQKYYDAVSHAGLSGELSFQHQAEDFIKINMR